MEFMMVGVNRAPDDDGIGLGLDNSALRYCDTDVEKYRRCSGLLGHPVDGTMRGCCAAETVESPWSRITNP